MQVRPLLSFVSKVTAVHFVTYYIAGMISFRLVLYHYMPGIGDRALPSYYKDLNDFALWVIPGQIARGILLGIALYPFRARFLELGHWGGLAIAGLYLLIGQFACPGTSPGSIEGFVYTRLPLDFQFAVMPEIIGQGLALGYLVYFWERYTSRPRLNTA
jgi:hypothetical protein